MTQYRHLFYLKICKNGIWSKSVPMLARTEPDAIQSALDFPSWLNCDRIVVMRASDGSKVSEWPVQS